MTQGDAPKAPPPAKPAVAPPAVPEAFEAVLQGVPEPQRERVRETFAALLQFQGPMPHPLLNKLTTEHLDKLIEGAELDNQRMYQDKNQGRKHGRFIAIVGVVAFFAISGLFLWMNQGDLLKGILIGLAVFLGGLGAGSRFIPRPDDD